MYLPRSLQSRVSTIHTVALTADVFQFFIKNIYNTRERPTIKLVELSINNHVLIAIHKHHKYYSEYLLRTNHEWMEYSTSAANDRVWRITQLAKLSFTVFFAQNSSSASVVEDNCYQSKSAGGTILLGITLYLLVSLLCTYDCVRPTT